MGWPLALWSVSRLLPLLPLPVEQIYEAICECQKLYPDQEQSNSEEEEEEEGEEGESGVVFDPSGGEFFTNPEGLRHLSAEGVATLAHLETIIQLPSPDQFQAMVSNGNGTGMNCLHTTHVRARAAIPDHDCIYSLGHMHAGAQPSETVLQWSSLKMQIDTPIIIPHVRVTALHTDATPPQLHLVSLLLYIIMCFLQ